MAQLQAYAHMFISNTFDINENNIYICMIQKLNEIDMKSRCNITSSFEILKLWKIVEGWVIQMKWEVWK